MRPGASPVWGPIGGHLAVEEGDDPQAAEEDSQARKALHRVTPGEGARAKDERWIEAQLRPPEGQGSLNGSESDEGSRLVTVS